MAIKFDQKELDEQYPLDKENIARKWFFVGAELKRIKRQYRSTKHFGQHVAKSDFAAVENHDRSAAIWLYGHRREVLDWLKAETSFPPNDPFRQLASLGASHPAHIKRQVLKWQKTLDKEV